ncbi:uncharacterized protein BDR25DRAFT_306820 [Lindgomyces ingoldianus]|uniref:Uncharacterized protein n=1 Tax=Lindgomyces ingoldianus TaxID=673940 RepID=A0ACB6QEY3_9PLEO|nr:uncharacterized protein BDR25DRAFT_306820 [Lindgomyces ingoldianus]KAF2465173.1 hypothetical protein BDR25DRAFT_306820 [Lindgomyces ingoldianus]
MNPIRRSCQSARLGLNPTVPIASGSRRAFSQCRACQRGSLPQFLTPSTPELSTLLSRLNSKILLPAHLNHDQQLLVYKKKNQTRLEAETINITLGEVTLPLEHIDRNRDIPNKWHTFKTVVEESSTPEDWENVLRMVEGFQDASIQLPEGWMQKVVRRLNQAGMQHLVLKALQRASATGMSLEDPAIAHFVMMGIHDKAASSNWEKEETKKALSMAEQVVELMERKEHLGRNDVLPGDLRSSPFVIAIPLEMAAVRVKKYTEGQDKDGKVARYALKIMIALEQDDWVKVSLAKELTAMTPSQGLRSAKDTLLNLRRRIWKLIPLWNALKTANSVLGANMPMAKEAQKLVANLRRGLADGEVSIDELTATKTEGYVRSVRKAIKDCEEL